MDLDGLSTAAGVAASPGANKHGPAAEALLEGAENGTETEDAAGSSDAAAAAGMRPQGPVDWAAAGAAGAAEDWQGNASAEAAMTAVGGAAEDGPGAAVEAKAAMVAMSPAAPINWDTAVGVRPPRPADGTR